MNTQPEPQTGAPMRQIHIGTRMRWINTAVHLLIVLVVLAGFIAAAGYYLSKRQHYTFCLVMAGVECIFIPFGTVLGIFTIIVLARPVVKALFEPGEPVEPVPNLPDA